MTFKVTYKTERVKMNGDIVSTEVLFKKTEDLKVALKAVEDCNKENGNVTLESTDE